MYAWIFIVAIVFMTVSIGFRSDALYVVGAIF